MPQNINNATILEPEKTPATFGLNDFIIIIQVRRVNGREEGQKGGKGGLICTRMCLHFAYFN